MHKVLADIGLGASIIGAILVLLDWHLPDLSKQRLAFLSLATWNYLDDIQRRMLLIRFDRGWLQYAAILLATALLTWEVYDGFEESWLRQIPFGADLHASYWVYLRNNPRDLEWLGTIIAMESFSAMITLPFILRLYRKLSKDNEPASDYISYLLVVSFVGMVIALGLSKALESSALSISYWLDGSESMALATGIVDKIIVLVLAVPSLSLAILGGVTIALLAILSVAKGFVKVGEVTLRKIAESPKGPLLAGSGLLGIVAGLVKAFG